MSISNNESFWILGGVTAQPEPPDDTLYFEAKTSKVSEGIDLKNGAGRHRHCAVNVEFPVSKGNLVGQWNQVVVIGGKEVGRRVETFCKGSAVLNHTVCNVQTETSNWSEFPSILEARDGFSCTSFQYRDLGAAIMIGGGLINSTDGNKTSSEIFLIEQCALNGNDCEWRDKINGRPIDIPGLPRVDAAVTTLNNIPTLFGGAFNVSGHITATGTVLQFVDTDENGTPGNEWKINGTMEVPRQQHSVVSVPIDFLCHQETTPLISRYIMKKCI